MIKNKDIIFKGNHNGAVITPLVIDFGASGNVGIGTTSPGYRLDVTEGDGNFTGIVSRFTGGGSPELGISVLSIKLKIDFISWTSTPRLNI